MALFQGNNKYNAFNESNAQMHITIAFLFQLFL